jgi:hypothetical protein
MTRRKTILVAVGAAVVLAVGGAVWLGFHHSGSTAQAAAQAPTNPEQQQGQAGHAAAKGGQPAAKSTPTRHIQLTVTGSGPVSIAYDTTGTGLVRRENSIALPWHDEYRWPANQPLQVIQLLVQSTKTATCTVTVDGKVAVSKTSTAENPVAICYAKFTPTH